MVIKKIKVKNFKCFENEKFEKLGEPNGENGSGLNIFVGENNSGKSTMFEALLKIIPNQNILDEEKRDLKISFSLEIEDSEGKKRQIKNIDFFGELLEQRGESDFSQENLEFISSRRYWNSRFGGGDTTFENFSKTKLRSEKNNIDGDLGSLLKHIIEEGKKDEFTRNMQKFISNFNDWSIAEDKHGKFVRYLVDKDIFHEADLLSDGTASLFRIVAHIVNAGTDKILLFDEPELSLHPQAQKRLCQVLKKMAKKRQIFIATHSPYFVDSDLIGNVFRFENQNSKGVRVCQINEPEKVKNLFHLENREIFFSKKVLLVEGFQDRVRFRKFLEKCDIQDFFVIEGFKHEKKVKKFVMI